MGDDAGTFDGAVASVSGGVPVAVAAAAIVAKMTPDEKLWCLDGDVPFWAGLGDLGQGGYHKRTFPAARIDRLGIPGFNFCDGPRGVVVGPATCFPVSMARGATWDLDLEERIGEAIGKEIRAVGADLFGGVCVNVLRHPAWGRAQETYGEDPHLVGEFGAALVRGVQRHAMATVKHFACNSMENSRFKVNVSVDEAALHEIFLPQFRRIVEEGVAVVMSAYNAVNGEWCGQDHVLLTDVLRQEWGFDGIVISDFIFGIRDAARSVEAGLDVEMPYRMVRSSGLRSALDRGEVQWDDIDRSVVRTMSTLLRFNHLSNSPRPDQALMACPAHRGLAREAATKAVVLLRNEAVGAHPLLPLDVSSLRRVAVIGTLADLRNTGDGGSSDVWAPEVVTPLEGLRSALAGVQVLFDDGDDVARASAVASSSGVAIVVVGYTKADEGEFIGGSSTTDLLSALLPGPDEPALAESFLARVQSIPDPEPPEGMALDGSLSFTTGGDRASLRLHAKDEALIAAVVQANPRTVVVVVAGSAVMMSSWAFDVPAVIQSWYAGMEGGHGLADVLIGRHNADGRLPFTVPTSEEHLPAFDRDAESATYDAWHGWWRLERDGHQPMYPFGFGLSYTTFSWATFTANYTADAVLVKGTVANSGDRRGAEVIQVFGGPFECDGVGRPRRVLGFARIELNPGQETLVEIPIARSRFAVRDVSAHQWIVRSGEYQLEIGRYVGDASAQKMNVDVM
jgi:beta-glucosidase